MEKWLFLFLLAIAVEIATFVYIHLNQKRGSTDSELQGKNGEFDGEVEHFWLASIHSRLEFYGIIAVFTCFITLSFFIAKNPARTIRDLFLAMVTGCLAAALGMISKSLYQITETGVVRTQLFKKKRVSKLLFRWDDLVSIKKSLHGIKYKLKEDEAEQGSTADKKKKNDKKKTQGFIPLGSDAQVVMEIFNARGFTLS